MADDFTLLDHIAPYVPCLGRFRRSRIFLLPSPPASTSNLATTGTSTRGDPDLLSLHSNIGRERELYHVTDTEHSLSRWQLLQSWWNTSTTRDDRKRGQALHTSDDAHNGEEDAQELLLSTASPQSSPQKRHSSPRRSPRPRTGKQRSSSRYSDSAHTASSDETRSRSSGRKHKRGKKRDTQRAYSDYTESTIDEEDAQSQSTAPTSVPEDERVTGKDTLV